ncbi:hypothetical protein M440DRAFT_1390066 [Trichoderma longibrachiatum ATCC 18648]|uniref:Uncharacterized protein n=1 Tax=Trichoderma longibrachiatum ATCC 18648 TaxID=983965 RepID=A0A2T4C9Y0_TRILO|nr:hypothetical protein M440DRAFT_1390066 [Trichoderma longibrachiatum ATCC 18648]
MALSFDVADEGTSEMDTEYRRNIVPTAQAVLTHVGTMKSNFDLFVSTSAAACTIALSMPWMITDSMYLLKYQQPRMHGIVVSFVQYSIPVTEPGTTDLFIIHASPIVKETIGSVKAAQHAVKQNLKSRRQGELKVQVPNARFPVRAIGVTCACIQAVEGS